MNRRTNRKILQKISLTLVAIVLLTLITSVNMDNSFVYADDKKEIIVVIDPGHGGSQNGAEYNERLEKDLTMKVSKVFAEELSKYDGVKVYLTHDSANDTMSIKARADYADKVKADYFFCVHFNASGNHNLYGSEAWITSFGRYYSEMYAFSEIVLKEFEDIGVFNRGIKTKLEVDGTDYYGVLRRGAEYDIPAVIIEHCHMDNSVDEQFLDEEADYELFGKLDAKAAAKFLRLKSSELGIDYTDYEYELPEEPKEPIPNDETAPLCSVTVMDVNLNSKKIYFQINASDEEQPILYYSYSVDGGKSYEPLEMWDKNAGYMECMIDYESIRDKKILFKVLNGFNIEGYAKEISIDDMVSRQEALVATEEDSLEAAIEALRDGNEQYAQPISGGVFYLIIAIVALVGVLGILIVVLLVFFRKKDTVKRSN